MGWERGVGAPGGRCRWRGEVFLVAGGSGYGAEFVERDEVMEFAWRCVERGRLFGALC